VPLHRVWEYRDIGRLFITVGGKRVIIGVLRWGWVEVILRVSLEVILRKPLRHTPDFSSAIDRAPGARSKSDEKSGVTIMNG